MDEENGGTVSLPFRKNPSEPALGLRKRVWCSSATSSWYRKGQFGEGAASALAPSPAPVPPQQLREERRRSHRQHEGNSLLGTALFAFPPPPGPRVKLKNVPKPQSPAFRAATPPRNPPGLALGAKKGRRVEPRDCNPRRAPAGRCRLQPLLPCSTEEDGFLQQQGEKKSSHPTEPGSWRTRRAFQHSPGPQRGGGLCSPPHIAPSPTGGSSFLFPSPSIKKGARQTKRFKIKKKHWEHGRSERLQSPPEIS